MLKYFILCVLSLFFVHFSYAGLPDQDQRIADLRKAFAVARVPTEDDLRLTQAIACTEYMANPYDFSSTTTEKLYQFQRFEGAYYNEGECPTKNYTLDPVIGLKSWVKRPGNWAEYIDVIRVLPNGDLITEWGGRPANTGSVPALADASYGAVSYTVCPSK